MRCGSIFTNYTGTKIKNYCIGVREGLQKEFTHASFSNLISTDHEANTHKEPTPIHKKWTTWSNLHQRRIIIEVKGPYSEGYGIRCTIILNDNQAMSLSLAVKIHKIAQHSLKLGVLAYNGIC